MRKKLFPILAAISVALAVASATIPGFAAGATIEFIVMAIVFIVFSVVVLSTAEA